MAAKSTFEMAAALWHIAHRPRKMVSLGVFPADRLPSVQNIQSALANAGNCCCFIANTDPKGQPGKHWVLFIATLMDRGRIQLEYFDSYGLPMPMHADLYDACCRNGYLRLVNECNTVCLQDVGSSVCGYYCLLVAHFRAIGRTFTSTIDCLRSQAKSPEKRDEYAVNAIHSVFHRRRYYTHPKTMPNCLARSSRGLHQTCCSASNSSVQKWVH